MSLAFLSSMSLRTLVFWSFSAVTLPLALVLASSMMSIGDVSGKGVNAVKQVADVVFTSQQLSTLLSNMERTASQYQVLADEDLKQQYLVQRTEFLAAVESAYGGAHSAQLEGVLGQLTSTEERVYTGLMHADSAMTLTQVQQEFGELHTYAQALFALNNDIISAEINAIEQSASEVSDKLLRSTLIFPITLLLAVCFMGIINRPLKQLMPQLKQLELGDLNHQIKVSGAKDFQDIATTIENMRIQLQSLEEQKKQSLQHLSHELKTPLAAIREGTELLYDGTSGQLNEAQTHIAGILRSSTGRLQKLIEALLDLNIIIAAKLPAQDRYCEVEQVVKDVRQARSLEISAKALDLKLTIPAGLSLPMQEEHCRIVLDNVLSNAIRFSPEQGEISLVIEQSEEMLTIQVSDEGPGLPEGESEQVFELFYQARNQPESKVKGSGMGLTLTREILNKYGASIRLKNNTAQQGCCAEIQLPIIRKKN